MSDLFNINLFYIVASPFHHQENIGKETALLLPQEQMVMELQKGVGEEAP